MNNELGNEITNQQVPAQPVSVQPVPVQPVPAQPVPVQQVPVEQVPVQPVPVQPVSVEQVPVQPVPVQPVPVQPVPVEQVPVQPVPVQPVPVEQVPVQPVPVQPVPVEQVPVQPVPVQPVPVEQVPVQTVPVQPVPVQQVPVEQVAPAVVATPVVAATPIEEATTYYIDENGQQQPVTQVEIDDNALVSAYIGQNSNSIMNKSFNVGAFFFNSIYFCYRKMFGTGLLVFLAMIGVLTLIIILGLPGVTLLLSILMSVLVGFFANKLIVKKAQKKVAAIKARNPGKTQQELEIICIDYKETSIGLAILGIVVQGILLLGVILVISIFSVVSIMNKAMGTYSGIIISDTSANISEEVTITVPPQFVKEDTPVYESTYLYTIDDSAYDRKECKLNIKVVKNFKDAELLAEQMLEYEHSNGENVPKVTKLNSNNLVWYSFPGMEIYGQEYNFLTKANKKLYLVTYTENDEEEKECSKYKNTIIKSIKIK